MAARRDLEPGDEVVIASEAMRGIVESSDPTIPGGYRVKLYETGAIIKVARNDLEPTGANVHRTRSTRRFGQRYN